MSVKSRIEKIERAVGTEPEIVNSPCLRFPTVDGGFIEVPGCRTLADVIALAQAGEE